ncbi:Deleted in malignant brain tumors 1 protein [Holothuria leucospilota]|uniref:Deleted in malignant brain tumors 1 protein n=1 Tax=Holothuria leucospilota TaxID=206669 RepID=A0A9Q1H4Q7_HOLLE|nr:Deleted in malignant brain tumors 1 protein [Holothuria leucospilota]
MNADIMYLRDPSGEFTSPGYPGTPSVYVEWNITVDEDHRILLQFSDFQLVERNPCSIDDFELYDGAFFMSLRRGRWCWDSFDKLTLTTYISIGNVFLLRFRTVSGYSRRGFKANYSSTTRKSATTNVLNITPTTAVGENLPCSIKSSTPTGIIVAIATSIIVAINVIVIAALIVWKYKMNNLSKDSSNDETSKALSRGNISTEMYEVVKEEDVHDIKSDYENTKLEGRGEKSVPTTDISMNVQNLKVYSKEIVRKGDLDTPDGTYETPDVNLYTYADPSEMKFCLTK